MVIDAAAPVLSDGRGMTIQAVVFDIGGVLERNPRTGWQERWAVELGLSSAVLEAIIAPTLQAGSIGRATLAQVHEQLAAALGLDAGRLERLMDDLWLEYLGSLNHELAAYFAGLRPRYRTGILSNSFVGAREREQAAYRLDRMCDDIVYSHEVGRMKPDREIYRIACSRLGAAPPEAVFLDDLQVNVSAAAALGMRAIRFESTAQAIVAVQRALRADGSGPSPTP